VRTLYALLGVLVAFGAVTLVLLLVDAYALFTR